MTKRILVVDDDPSILHALTRYFTRTGFTVDCATELEEAEALVAHVLYDLVIADLSLSELDSTEGLEIVRYVRRTSPTTRVIILTAHRSQSLELQARSRGCDALIHKPKPLLELAQLAIRLTGSAA